MRQSMSYNVGAALLLGLAAVACGNGQPRTPTTPTSADGVLGQYSLAVTTGSTCPTLPDIVRSRTYTASIDSRRPDDYVVTLSDARFLADEQIGERAFILHCSSHYGLSCNQFTASREGDQLRFRLAPNSERFDDEFAGYGGSIVELISLDNSRLEIDGTGLGRLDGTTIQASIDARVSYCSAKYFSTEECANCDTANVAMTFSRR